jgi:hypothetical protein
MATSKIATSRALETILKNSVHIYEKLHIEEAARIDARLARDSSIHLNDLYGKLDAPNQMVALLFHKDDEDDSSMIKRRWTPGSKISTWTVTVT